MRIDWNDNRNKKWFKIMKKFKENTIIVRIYSLLI